MLTTANREFTESGSGGTTNPPQDRQGVYKALSSEDNPSFVTVMKIIKALVVTLHVQAPIRNITGKMRM